jgi:molecular chaperone GrpE
MSESKGPRVDIPADLAAEIEAAERPPEPAREPAAAGAAEPSPQPAPAPAAEIAANRDASALDAELAELRDRYLRLAAEFDNHRRRTLKERQDLLNYGNETLIKELLATVDNLERALSHAQRAEEGADREKLLEGVELTYRSLIQSLARFGVERIEAQGQPFDPKLHEAVRQLPAEAPPNTVVEVFQPGYLLRDRLLRPALVAVSTGGSER